MTDEVLLSARGLERRFGHVQALRGIDLAVRRGEVVGLLGLNGAGKSTTMQLLTGALAADRGEVTVCGLSLTREPLAARRRLGYLPEIPPLDGDLTVDEYLLAAARLHGLPSAAAAPAAQRARDRSGLAEVGARVIAHLSKGYQQRVGLAQAIVHDPDVLVLDEPTSGLDPLQIRDVRALIAELGRERAVLLSSHLLHEVQMLAQRIAILHHGRIVHDAPLSGGGRLSARFATAPDARRLAILAGVRGVREDGGTWLLECTDAEELAPRLAALAVAEGWGLRALDPGQDGLETRFARLVSGAEAS